MYYNSGVRAPLSNAMKNEITGLEANVPFRTWDGDIKVSVPVAGKEPVVFKKQQDAILRISDILALSIINGWQVVQMLLCYSPIKQY